MTGDTVARVVRALERYYQASVDDPRPFVRAHDEPGGREVLLVRQGDEELEVSLFLPARLASGTWETFSLDERCQVVEGASHFLTICARARADRTTTQLELELQAEVDKWLILSNGGRLDHEADALLRDALYDPTYSLSFVHAANTTEGERYRLANNVAARFVHKLTRTYVRTGKQHAMRMELVRFFHMSQEEKLRAAAA